MRLNFCDILLQRFGTKPQSSEVSCIGINTRCCLFHMETVSVWSAQVHQTDDWAPQRMVPSQGLSMSLLPRQTGQLLAIARSRSVNQLMLPSLHKPLSLPLWPLCLWVSWRMTQSSRVKRLTGIHRKGQPIHLIIKIPWLSSFSGENSCETQIFSHFLPIQRGLSMAPPFP